MKFKDKKMKVILMTMLLKFHLINTRVSIVPNVVLIEWCCSAVSILKRRASKPSRNCSQLSMKVSRLSIAALVSVNVMTAEDPSKQSESVCEEKQKIKKSLTA